MYRFADELFCFVVGSVLGLAVGISMGLAGYSFNICVLVGFVSSLSVVWLHNRALDKQENSRDQ